MEITKEITQSAAANVDGRAMIPTGPGMNSYTYSGQDLSQKNFAPRVPGIEQFGILDGSEKMSTTTGTKVTNAYQEKDKLDVYYWFGSDLYGRDIWTRTWEGARVSLIIAVAAAIIDLREEVRTRENRKYLCRLKAAGLPARHDLDRYDFTRTEGIDSRKLRELRELVWVGQAYNLLLAGGSGTGKTYIAAGLVHEAVKAGYRAYMVTLEDLLTCLKTRDVSRHAMKTYKRIMKAQLLAIDNATLFPLKREDIMLLFKLVNEFQEKTSLIVTANYSLTEWLAIPGEEAVAAALLDRLLYCCEIIQLSRNSYRMENRKTIFSNRSEDTDTLKELTTVK